jgi:uncharacterized cupin superfamily protein
MHATPLAAIDPFHLPGIEHRTLAGAAQGLATLEVWHQSLDPGAATPPHSHDFDEVVVLLEGEAEVDEAGDLRRIAAPATVVLRAGRAHRIANVGTVAVRLVAAFAASPARARGPDGSLIPLPWEACETA